MAQDATGTPTALWGIPKYNTAVDPPSGKGFNAAMDYIDGIIIPDLLFDAKGDLIVATAADTAARLPVGANDLVLTADSAQAAGVKWASAAGLAAGTVTEFAGAAAPSGWLLCDGAAISRTTFSVLFTAIGTKYGVGDGSTTFNIPDTRGRTAVGKGTHTDVDDLGKSDGVATVANRRPKHYHTTTLYGDVGSGGALNNIGTTGGTLRSGDTDLGPTNNIKDTPAYLVFNYIIKT